eukprot:UN14261
MTRMATMETMHTRVKTYMNLNCGLTSIQSFWNAYSRELTLSLDGIWSLVKISFLKNCD